MKRIGLTQSLYLKEEYGEIREMLDVRWAELFQELGCLAVPIPLRSDLTIYLRAQKIDALCFTGGNDLSCISDTGVNRERDDFENRLIDTALECGMPMLGVCRGMQVLAHYFGTSLKSVNAHAGTKHVIKKEATSRFMDDIGRVNSYHNYGLTGVPNGFSVAAKSEDGEIEAIEHSQLRIFGQMWHPEREAPFQKTQIGILKKLLLTNS